MHHQNLLIIEVRQQIFGAAGKRLHPPPGEAGGKIDWQRKAQTGAALLDPHDARASQGRGEAGAYGFNFGEFGHVPHVGVSAAGCKALRPHATPRAVAIRPGPRYDTGMSDTGPTTHFGYDTVSLADKQGRVDDVFHKVASRYDLMNDLMSGGLHRAWKDVLVAMVKPRSAGFAHLDVAGGTGDVAFRVAKAGGAQTHVTVLDINGDMLDVGRARGEERRLGSQLTFVEANAEELPLPDKAFDCYTIAFGIRNVPRIELALAEAHRVLKTGGRFLCLEFSHVDVPGLDKAYDAFSFNAIPAIGRMVTGDAQPYQYLVESIRRFPAPEIFQDMIGAAGFRRAQFARLTGGVVAIHSGWKL